MVFQTLVNTTARRIPLIKFRKGGLALGGVKGAPQGQVGSTQSTKSSTAQSLGPTIEDWQLPQRFWRKPISDIEIEHINCGGPP